MSVGFWVGVVGNTMLAEDSVCVRVKIEIDQELTLERQGFEARMNIGNGGPTALENLGVVVKFRDANNNAVVATSDPNDLSAKFFIRLTSSAALPSRVAGGAEERLRWLIIPSPSAAEENPLGTLYFVGATLSYTTAGVPSAIEVSPDSIRVLPMPLLSLDYFLPYDVYGDDPFTTPIEPPIPFGLGVRVKNGGFGAARNVRIESSQPRIVENEQDLLIDFRIEGSEVNGGVATPSLLVDFGDIAADRSGVARWMMTASLYGRFVEFNATFTHADELGGQLTSLITDIRTHRLIHDVLVDLPGRDGIRDFLASDQDAIRVYESDSTEWDVLDLSDSAAISGEGSSRVISAPACAGFSYIQVPDPFSGSMVITSAVRGDGRPVNANNAWLSSTFRADARQWDYFVSVFDTGNPSGASYILNFGSPTGGNRAPVLRKPADRIVRVGGSVGFLVEASDADGDAIALSAGSLPVGASFVDNGSGMGVFSWAPGAAQTGNYPVRFTASDGRLRDEETTVITVTAGSLLKDWKNRYWPGITDLAIIGNNVDYDGDELPNLLEYALGLDPTDATLDGAPEIGTVEFGGQTYLTLTYVGRTDDPSLAFAVVGADSSVAPDEQWEILTERVPEDQGGIPQGFEKVTGRDDHPIDGTRQKRFLRLKVSTTEEE